MERGDRKKFEVGLFNQAVIDAIKRGERHKHLDDAWGDNRYVNVFAYDVEDARRRVAARFPPEEGYVVTSIDPVE